MLCYSNISQSYSEISSFHSNFLKTLSSERAACHPDHLKAVAVVVVVVVVVAAAAGAERSCAVVAAAAEATELSRCPEKWN